MKWNYIEIMSTTVLGILHGCMGAGGIGVPSPKVNLKCRIQATPMQTARPVTNSPYLKISKKSELYKIFLVIK